MPACDRPRKPRPLIEALSFVHFFCKWLAIADPHSNPQTHLRQPAYNCEPNLGESCYFTNLDTPPPVMNLDDESYSVWPMPTPYILPFMQLLILTFI